MRQRTFQRRLRDLTREELAAFVADLWTARGRQAVLDAGTITIHDPKSGLREQAVVLPNTRSPGCVSRIPDSADILVAPGTTRQLEDRADDIGARVVDGAGLARLLRYAVDSEDAETVVHQHLGAPPWTDGLRDLGTGYSATILAALDTAAARPTVRAVSVLGLAAVLVVAGVGASLAGPPGGGSASPAVTPVDPVDVPDTAGLGPSVGTSPLPLRAGTGGPSTAGAAGANVDGGAWRTLGGSAARSGFRPGIDGPRRNVTRGERAVRNVPVVSAPVVADGRLYVAQVDGTVVALDAQTLRPVWNRTLEGDITAGLSLMGETLFVGTAMDAEAPIQTRRGRTLTALHAENGSVKWDLEMASIVGSPAVVNDTVYVGTVEGWVHALDVHTGAIHWSASLHRSIRTAPAVAHGTVYVPDAGGGVTALDATIGRVEWETTVPGSIEAAPAVVGETVYVGTTAGAVHAINVTDGQERWRRTVGTDFGAAIWAGPAVAYDTVFVGSDDGWITAFDAATGRERWAAPVAGSIQAGPVVAGYVVYVAGRGANPYAGTSTSRVVAFEAESGRERWSHATDGPIVAQPALTDDALYIADTFGRVDRLDSCVDWRDIDIDRRGPNSPPHCSTEASGTGGAETGQDG